MWRSVALVLLCLLTFVVGLGQPAIQDSDEAFYAEAGREMVASGDWIDAALQLRAKAPEAGPVCTG